MTRLCAVCKTRPVRPKQRTCRPCHAKLMAHYRKVKKHAPAH